MAEIYKIDELRSELNQLLKKQSEILKARASGSASEVEIVEFDIRQEVIGEIQERLARSAAA
jgi:ElaB/YqjD/DUF883 family membrane-anchored ribosome-binding protein